MILGLTGSLGSGKSTVARMFEEEGNARLIDADEIARRVQLPGGDAFEEITRTFGTGILDAKGMIDRKRLASMVFSDHKKLNVLNSIVHPRVRTEELRQLREYCDHPLVVLMVPLLLENRMQSLVDRVVVVTVDEASRRKRLFDRSQMSGGEISKRLAAQMPDEQKVKQADFVVDNSGSLENTRNQVIRIIERIKQQG